MKLLFLYCVLFLTIPTTVTAQNLVPNPSFEDLYNLPVKPNRNNSYEYEPNSGYIPFQSNLKFWLAGSETTPDLRITNRKRYQDCDRIFDNCDKARTGRNSVGIITFMENTYTKNYREYVQVKLVRRLRPGIKTYVELWVAKERDAKLVSNNLGFHFSMKKQYEETIEMLDLTPQINDTTIINEEKKEWVKIGGSFIPEKPYKYVIYGNFFDREKTKIKPFKNYNGTPYSHPYAYYLTDDIKIWQEGDSTPIVFKEQVVKTNEPIRLENIEFDTDKSTLRPISIEELNELHQLLIKNDTLKIAIHGHTDDQGTTAYNQRLSEKRAKAVYDFLINKNVQAERLRYKGFGETEPIDDNETEAGREVNRRVEFIILE